MVWTEEMKQILISIYPKYGINKCIELLGLKEEHKSDVFNMRRCLKLKRENKYLTEEKIVYIKENYNNIGLEEMSKELNMSIKNIQSTASKLGFANRPVNNEWNNSDVEYLIKNYDKYDISELSKKLNRTPVAILCKSKKLKITGDNKRKKWNEYDINILKKYYPILDSKEIHDKFLKDRTPDSINTKSIKLGLKKEFSVGWDNSKKHVSNNGDICNSVYELEITNFLINNNIEYQKEVLYSKLIKDADCGKQRTDWVINKTTPVEFFGLMKVSGYREKAASKINLCKKHNIELICIYPSQINKLDEIFKNYINV